MIKRIGHITAVCLAALIFPGCAHRGTEKSEPAVHRAAPRTIALVPVMDPPSLKVQNRGGPLGPLALPGYLVRRQVEKDRSSSLASVLRAHYLKLGDEMTSALKEELVNRGYAVSVVSQVERPEDDPDDVVFESIRTDADAVVIARYDDAGLLSGFSSLSYIPRLNLKVEMLSRSDQTELYSQSLDYGADARKPDEDMIPADQKYAFGTFEEAMTRQTEVIESFRAGIRALAARTASQIHQAGL